MKIRYDAQVKAAYIELDNHPTESKSAGCVSYSKEITDDLVIDFNSLGKPIGIEILNTSGLEPLPSPTSGKEGK